MYEIFRKSFWNQEIVIVVAINKREDSRKSYFSRDAYEM